MVSKERTDQIFGGVFLIGLALLFFTGWWWPGIMYVIGVALLAKTYTEGKPLTSNTGAWVVIAIGVIFTAGGFFSILNINWLPLVLIGIGAYLLFGDRLRGGVSNWTSSSDESQYEEKKKKNDLV